MREEIGAERRQRKLALIGRRAIHISGGVARALRPGESEVMPFVALDVLAEVRVERMHRLFVFGDEARVHQERHARTCAATLIFGGGLDGDAVIGKSRITEAQ